MGATFFPMNQPMRAWPNSKAGCYIKKLRQPVSNHSSIQLLVSNHSSETRSSTEPLQVQVQVEGSSMWLSQRVTCMGWNITHGPSWIQWAGQCQQSSSKNRFTFKLHHSVETDDLAVVSSSRSIDQTASGASGHSQLKRDRHVPKLTQSKGKTKETSSFQLIQKRESARNPLTFRNNRVLCHAFCAFPLGLWIRFCLSVSSGFPDDALELWASQINTSHRPHRLAHHPSWTSWRQWLHHRWRPSGCPFPKPGSTGSFDHRLKNAGLHSEWRTTFRAHDPQSIFNLLGCGDRACSRNKRNLDLVDSRNLHNFSCNQIVKKIIHSL